MVLYEMDLGLLDGPSSTVQVRSLFLLYRLLTLLQVEKKYYGWFSYTTNTRDVRLKKMFQTNSQHLLTDHWPFTIKVKRSLLLK